MKDLFYTIKEVLLQHGKSKYVASVMASHICLNCNLAMKNGSMNKEEFKKLKDLWLKELK